MWRAVEILGFLLVAVVAVSFFLVGYLLCCGPGVGLLWVLKRYSGHSRLMMTAGVAVVHAVFFAPALVAVGHSGFVVPVFAGVLVYWLVGETGRSWWLSLAISAGVVFGGSLICQQMSAVYRRRV